MATLTTSFRIQYSSRAAYRGREHQAKLTFSDMVLSSPWFKTRQEAKDWTNNKAKVYAEEEKTD